MIRFRNPGTQYSTQIQVIKQLYAALGSQAYFTLDDMAVVIAQSLITELIKAYCPKNKDGFYEGIILDPFHGSGTLGVCCEKLNKQGHKIRWIGIELEQRWCDIAQERLNQIQ